MINNNTINNWVYEHFVCYLYLCIADADYNISDDEIDKIHEKISRSLKHGKNYIKIIAEVLNEFKNHTDYERTDFINKNVKKYCIDSNTKSKIISDLEEIMEADGIIKSVEMIMFRYIKKTIEETE